MWRPYISQHPSFLRVWQFIFSFPDEISKVAGHACFSLLVMTMSMLRELKILEGCCPWLCCSFGFFVKAFSALQAQQQTHYWPCYQLLYTAIIAERPCRCTPSGSQDDARKRKAAAGPSQGKEGSWEPTSKRKQRADCKQPALQGGSQRSGSRAGSQQPAMRPFGRTTVARAGPRADLKGADPKGEPLLLMHASQHSTSHLEQAQHLQLGSQMQPRLLKRYVQSVHLRMQLSAFSCSRAGCCSSCSAPSLLHAGPRCDTLVASPCMLQCLLRVVSEHHKVRIFSHTTWCPSRRLPWRAHPC